MAFSQLWLDKTKTNQANEKPFSVASHGVEPSSSALFFFFFVISVFRELSFHFLQDTHWTGAVCSRGWVM